MKRIFILLFLFCLFFSTSLWASSGPTLEIKKVVDAVLKVLNQPDLDYAGKRLKVSGMVQKFINIDSISQRTLGVHWKRASPEQQARFSRLFVQVLENTYLNRIEDYSGGTVEYINERVKEDKAIVDTVFVSDKLEVPVQYKMVLQQGVWQIYDVVIENVSLVRNYRSSYGDIVSSEGLEGLFVRLESKLAEPAGSGKKE
ncbi:MAG TPA: ABC transporter substrate-binding protein [Geopsychrobacteraceae bacterium]|nr:ABC transporter substrate-binding protein [Geopsychrobacteraceae bacterium]